MSLLFPNMLALRMQSISCFKNKVGVLPAVTMTKFQELIQIKMSSCSLWKFLGYGQAGIRIGLKLQISIVFWKIMNLISENLNIERTIVALKMTLCFVLNFKLKERLGRTIKKVFVEAGFTVTEIAETEAKELD